MARPKSYGSKSNRERRREVAQVNATKEQIDCLTCGSKHRKGRACR